MMHVLGKQPTFEEFFNNEQMLQGHMEKFNASKYTNKEQETEAFQELYNWMQFSPERDEVPSRKIF